MTKRAVILAGGRGTRLAPYTAVFPKPLMPLGETPILEIILRQMAAQHITDITLCVGYLSQLVQAYCGDGSQFGLSLDYSRETEPLGTAGPLRLVERLDLPFLVMNGDVLTTLNYGSFLDAHVSSGADMTISTFVRTNTVDFGVIDSDAQGRLTGYSEKPQAQYNVSMGVNALSPGVLEFIEPGTRLDIPDLVLRLVAAGKIVNVAPFDGYWLDVGRHEDFSHAQEEFEAHKSDFLGA